MNLVQGPPVHKSQLQVNCCERQLPVNAIIVLLALSL